MNLLYIFTIPYYILLEYLLIIWIKIKELATNNTPQEWEKGNKGTVILIQGINSKVIGLSKIGNSLNKLGYKITTLPELIYNTKPIKDSSKILENYLLANNLQGVYLVVHSKGGVIAKHFLDTSKESSRIKKVISIAVPYGGSHFAKILNIRELLPSSMAIKLISKSQVNNNKIINLYPKFDNHVIPNKNLLLKGAKNIQIDVIGHTRILVSRKTIDAITRYL